MNVTKAIVRHVLEDEEPPEHLKTRHRVRDQQQLTDRYFRIFGTSFGKPSVDQGQDVGFTSGSRKFERVDGVWWEEKKAKNPAYYSLPRYFVIYPGPEGSTFIVVKMPRTLNTALWRSACNGIYRDATGYSWTNVYGAKARSTGSRQQAGVDGADEGIYAARVSGKKHEPAYEIFPDGTWKKTSP